MKIFAQLHIYNLQMPLKFQTKAMIISVDTDAACFARVSVGDGKKYGLTRETGKAT